MVRASCLCGDVVYEAEGEFKHMTHCHCSVCRKIHGAPFATYVGVPTEGIRWISGADRRTRYPSSPGFVRAFCSTCGSVVPTPEKGGPLTFVPAGNLEEDCGARPEGHIFTGSKAAWYTITDGLPQFEAYPPGYDAQPVEPAPRCGGGDGVAAGSCLCGAVAFEYDGEPATMRNCHCSRCRRAKSAAHATNVFVRPEAFRWVSGEAEVVVYKLPEAERFGNAFCRVCGSSVPRVTPGAPLVNVPAGALDGDPGMRPVAHIFVGSKAPWFDITDDLPRFPGMSPS